MSKNLSKEEIRERQEQEQRLKGMSDNIQPSEHLNERQTELFNWLVTEMKASGILSNLDVFVLDEVSIAIERMQYIDTLINKYPDENLLNKDLRTSREHYLKSFQRCCNELSLSPQSRAKLGNINIQNQEKEKDPLLNALKVM